MFRECAKATEQKGNQNQSMTQTKVELSRKETVTKSTSVRSVFSVVMVAATMSRHSFEVTHTSVTTGSRLCSQSPSCLVYQIGGIVALTLQTFCEAKEIT